MSWAIPVSYTHLGIVDTGKISARVCTKGCPVGHLSFQQERILLFPSGKFHGYGIAPVAADLHRIGGFDLLAGIQKLSLIHISKESE